MKQMSVYLLILLAGLVGGGALVALAPELVHRAVPGFIRGPGEVVQGEVMRKLEKGDRLLLTVVTPRGAILATFLDRHADVSLLIDEGDQLTLELPRFAPFVSDPAVRQVLKPNRPVPAAPGVGPAAPEATKPPPPAEPAPPSR